MKSVCSGHHPVKLQVSPVVILELALILHELLFSPIKDVNFLHCSLHPLLFWHCGKQFVAVSPAHSHQGAIRAPSRQPPLLQAEQSQLSQPFFVHSVLLPCPACVPLLGGYLSLFLFWGAPNWAQCSRRSLSSAKPWEGLLPSAVLQWWADFSWPLWS